MRKEWRKGERDASEFRSLPERAQEIWFQYCDVAIKNKQLYDLIFIHIKGLDYSECKSPIEVIFNFAFDLIIFSQGYMGMCLFPQYKVTYGRKRYYLDFVFLASDIEDIFDIENPNFKLAIECDGHNFHEKTKEQVISDNNKDYAVQMLGFDILRFSGSQIYKEPFQCAEKTLKYIFKQMGEI